MELEVSYIENPITESLEDYITDDYIQSMLEMSLEDALDEYIATIDSIQ